MPVTNGYPEGGRALCTVDEFVAQTYDFIVVGGGTAGCVVAARLSEDSHVTVGLIEAGENRLDDRNVLTPSLYPTMIGRKEYDYCMSSIPQPNAGNKIYSMPRGKLLGGSSGINYLMYVRGSRNDYDGWASIIGDKAWGWDGLASYFRKHQKLDHSQPLAKDPQFMPHAEPEKWHGESGPIHTSFNDWVTFPHLQCGWHS